MTSIPSDSEDELHLMMYSYYIIDAESLYLTKNICIHYNELYRQESLVGAKKASLTCFQSIGGQTHRETADS